MAWFDKRITQEKLDKMDTQFTKRYGKIKVVREKDLPIEDDKYLSIVDEEKQILDDARRREEAIDRDEKYEYESIEPEKEKSY